MKLAINIAAMLIAFISVIALLNWLLGLISFGDTVLSIELILGYVFMPLAFLLGASWSEAQLQILEDFCFKVKIDGKKFLDSYKTPNLISST